MRTSWSIRRQHPRDESPEAETSRPTTAHRGHGGLTSFAPFVLVVSAAFIHAFWSLFSKRAADTGASFVFAYNLVSCVAYAPWVIWLLQHTEMPWTWSAIGGIVASGLKRLIAIVTLRNVTSRFAMEQIKAETALPITLERERARFSIVHVEKAHSRTAIIVAERA